MTDLDRLYALQLQVGFIVLRHAIESGDQVWVDAELELLHNIPSLLGEPNRRRHIYFWKEEIGHYLEWMLNHGSDEARSQMKTFYESIWSEHDSLIQRYRVIDQT